MPEAKLIEPDLEFVRELSTSGGETLKKCYQCATCSVVCGVSPDREAFPRKEMLWAQWGLRERLMGDPAVWLCHQCGACSLRCPRGARPGDVLGAARNLAIQDLAFPRVLGKMVSDLRFLPLLLFPPVFILLAVVKLTAGGFAIPAGEIEFAKLFGMIPLEGVFFAVSGFASVAFLVGFLRLFKRLRASGACSSIGELIAGSFGAVPKVLLHSEFRKCIEERWRWLGHMATLFGFTALFIVGTILGVGSMFAVEWLKTPLALTHPVKLFANFGAVLILVGCTFLLYGRLARDEKRERSTYYDWFFLGLLILVVLTGILTELSRLAELAAFAYPVYFVHLVAAFSLLLYAPYSKFAHLVYRFVAMACAERTRRTTP